MNGKHKFYFGLVVVLVALLATVSVTFAQLQVTATPLSAWDWGSKPPTWTNGNALLYQGHWEPMFVQFDKFDATAYPTACGDTVYAGVVQIGLSHIDQVDGTIFGLAGDPTKQTKDWRLTTCTDVAAITDPAVEPTNICPGTGLGPCLTRTITDAYSPCSNGACKTELVNEFDVNIDYLNCDGTPDNNIDPNNLCLYYQAYVVGPWDNGYMQPKPPVQGRVTDKVSGDKTVNFKLAGPNAVTLRDLGAASVFAPQFGLALVGLLAAAGAGIVYKRRH